MPDCEACSSGEPEDFEVSLDALFDLRQSIKKVEDEKEREELEKEFRAVKVAFDLSRGADRRRAYFWRGEAAKRLLSLKYRLGI